MLKRPNFFSSFFTIFMLIPHSANILHNLAYKLLYLKSSQKTTKIKEFETNTSSFDFSSCSLSYSVGISFCHKESTPNKK